MNYNYTNYLSPNKFMQTKFHCLILYRLLTYPYYMHILNCKYYTWTSFSIFPSLIGTRKVTLVYCTYTYIYIQYSCSTFLCPFKLRVHWMQQTIRNGSNGESKSNRFDRLTYMDEYARMQYKRFHFQSIRFVRPCMPVDTSNRFEFSFVEISSSHLLSVQLQFYFKNTVNKFKSQRMIYKIHSDNYRHKLQWIQCV